MSRSNHQPRFESSGAILPDALRAENALCAAPLQRWHSAIHAASRWRLGVCVRPCGDFGFIDHFDVVELFARLRRRQGQECGFRFSSVISIPSLMTMSQVQMKQSMLGRQVLPLNSIATSAGRRRMLATIWRRVAPSVRCRPRWRRACRCGTRCGGAARSSRFDHGAWIIAHAAWTSPWTFGIVVVTVLPRYPLSSHGQSSTSHRRACEGRVNRWPGSLEVAHGVGYRLRVGHPMPRSALASCSADSRSLVTTDRAGRQRWSPDSDGRRVGAIIRTNTVEAIIAGARKVRPVQSTASRALSIRSARRRRQLGSGFIRPQPKCGWCQGFGALRFGIWTRTKGDEGFGGVGGGERLFGGLSRQPLRDVLRTRRRLFHREPAPTCQTAPFQVRNRRLERVDSCSTRPNPRLNLSPWCSSAVVEPVSFMASRG